MKITIITTTYNSEQTLPDTINSILQQSYNNYEYIIIDGNSKDNTINIIKEYEEQFKGKLKWISEKDKGIYDAMNKGILLASGDVIGILNSDDFFTSNNILEIIAKSFNENNVDAIYGDIHFVNNKDLNKCVRYYSSKIFKPYLMRFGLMPAHPSFYIKREKIYQIGLYDTSYKIASDFDFLLRAIYIKKIKTLYIKKDFVTMRTGGVSTSGLSSYILIMREHLTILKKNGMYSNILLLMLRYVYKIYEIIYSKISYQQSINKKHYL